MTNHRTGKTKKTSKTADLDRQGTPDSFENVVSLRGRLTAAPEERLLPSGDRLVTFRLSVPRERTTMRASRSSADWMDCAAWGARVRRTASSWAAGDVVELSGALRRRFFRTGAGTGTRLEVEVVSGRRLSRAVRA